MQTTTAILFACIPCFASASPATAVAPSQFTVGSYYFQYCVGPQPVRYEEQKGLQAMASDGVFQWIKPENLVKTFDHEANTIEDFIFTANAVDKLQGRCTVVVEPNDFPDTASTSDHRPVRATFTILTAAPDVELRQRIRQRILEIRAEVQELEALVRQLPD